jgi:hypothetical protein
MSTQKDRFAEWDAAYILGALSSAERHEFEDHLVDCDSCTAAVNEMAVVPGLLARVPSYEIESWLADDADPAIGPYRPADDSLPNLLTAARKRRRRTRGLTVSITLAAAAVAVVLALVIPGAIAGSTSGQQVAALSMSQVVASPLSANVRLVSEPWGTRIETTCTYALGDQTGWSGANVAKTYGLFVTDTSGTLTKVSSWTAGPGSVVKPTGTTSVAINNIASVEIRSVPDGVTLLKKSLD